MSESGHKLWGGRFSKGLAVAAVQLSYSIESDSHMVNQDIAVNRAHAKALHKAGILSDEELAKVVAVLEDLVHEFPIKYDVSSLPDEDIHSCIERILTEKLGDLGKKIHTGKSRNDQVATDLRLYMRGAVEEIQEGISGLIRAHLYLAERYTTQIFPGFTHLQIAQPVLFSHHMLAYVEKYERDLGRFEDLLKRFDQCPLGSAAMAGSNYDLDREMLAKELGFAGITQNSMDAVSSRDHLLEFHSACAILATHVSQFCEELVIWSSPMVKLIEIGEEYTTGSSIMPQKKNPDMAELIRGKAGQFLGNFVALHELVKGLPLTYNRDLQEDKPPVFRSVETLRLVLACMAGMVASVALYEERIKVALESGHILATELADYLAEKGVPFREAHAITGLAVRKADEDGKQIHELSLDVLKGFSNVIEDDIFSVMSFENAINKKALRGGTALSQVESQLKEKIERYGKWNEH